VGHAADERDRHHDRAGLDVAGLAFDRDIYGVDRSTVSAAIRQIRPLLAHRGFATPAGQRLHTLADVLAYAAAEGLTVRLDGTEIQVRRPKPNRPSRRAFVSGKRKQNTIKATIGLQIDAADLVRGLRPPDR
jgi:hypothetical protein